MSASPLSCLGTFEGHENGGAIGGGSSRWGTGSEATVFPENGLSDLLVPLCYVRPRRTWHLVILIVSVYFLPRTE